MLTRKDYRKIADELCKINPNMWMWRECPEAEVAGVLLGFLFKQENFDYQKFYDYVRKRNEKIGDLISMYHANMYFKGHTEGTR